MGVTSLLTTTMLLAIIAGRIKSRLGTYLGDAEKMNAMLYVVVVLDPRYILEYGLSTIRAFTRIRLVKMCVI